MILLLCWNFLNSHLIQASVRYNYGASALTAFLLHFLLSSDVLYSVSVAAKQYSLITSDFNLNKYETCTSTVGFAVLLLRRFVVLDCAVAMDSDTGNMSCRTQTLL